MNIVIAEASTSHNIGSMALIENAIKISRTIDPNANIIVLSSDKNSVIESLSKTISTDKIEVLDDLFLFPKGTTIYKVIWGIKTLTWILLIRLLLIFTSNPQKYICGYRKQILERIKASDYVFCIGAERINDIYYKTAYLSLEALDIYVKMHAKLVHFSLTIGPIFKKSTIQKAAKVLNKSYAIFVRDKKSFDLLDELNVHGPYCVNTFDIAILQDRLYDNEGCKLLKDLSLPSEYICCSVIDWAFNKCKGPAKMPEYNKAVAETLDYIIEKYNIPIVLTPTVVGTYKVDDVEAGTNMLNYMKNKDKVININKLLSPSELSYVFYKSKFSIVTRMHAAILCTGAGEKPIIAINYLYKLREYMKNIGFEDYSVDIDYVNTQKLKQDVDNMIIHYEDNKKLLNKNLGLMKSNLDQNIIQFFKL